MDKYSSVTLLVHSMKKSLEASFYSVQVIGEVGNLSLSSNGHYYFNLKDAQSTVACTLFKIDALRNIDVKKIKTGDRVVCTGSITIYPQRGSLQLTVKRLSIFGQGDLNIQLEVLKQKLSSEGLFDSTHKKEIISNPERIGLVTSETGAAIQDFLSIFTRRSHKHRIILSPSQVQGAQASSNIIQSLRKLIQLHLSSEENALDVIVITRGGGSLEDLWCFNDEALAWEIYNCPVPVISAIGHEIDFTICDLVADLRAETPSAAAEILTSISQKNTQRMLGVKNRLDTFSSFMTSKISFYKNKNNPNYWQSLIEQKLQKNKLRLLHNSIVTRPNEILKIYEKTQRLDDCFQSLESFSEKPAEYYHKLENLETLLSAINPDNVLKRGYSYVRLKDGSIVSRKVDFDKLTKEQEFDIKFNDGFSRVVK